MYHKIVEKESTDPSVTHQTYQLKYVEYTKCKAHIEALLKRQIQAVLTLNDIQDDELSKQRSAQFKNTSSATKKTLHDKIGKLLKT